MLKYHDFFLYANDIQLLPKMPPEHKMTKIVTGVSPSSACRQDTKNNNKINK
jgi:hypothetical protein